MQQVTTLKMAGKDMEIKEPKNMRVRKLEDKQKVFVDALIETEHPLKALAATQKDGSRPKASWLLHQLNDFYSSPTVIENIAIRRNGLREELKDMAVIAVDTLQDVMLNSTSDKLRLDAANSCLDRSGHGAQKETKISGNVSFTNAMAGISERMRNVTQDKDVLTLDA